MKTIITIGLSILSAMGFAQTNLTIFSNDAAFTLYVNGRAQNRVPDTQVEAVGVPGEQCNVRLVFEDPTLQEAKSIIYFNGSDHVIYEAKKNNSGKIVFRLTSEVGGNADPDASNVSSEDAMAIVSAPAKIVVKVAEQDMAANGDSFNAEDRKQIDYVVNMPQKSIPNESKAAESATPDVAAENQYERYRNVKGFCPAPNFTPQDVVGFRRAVEDMSSDGGRARVFRDYITMRCVTSQQYGELMDKYLVSDKVKYELAKTLFDKVYDPGYFDLVRATLRSNEYKTMLDDFALPYLKSVGGGNGNAKTSKTEGNKAAPEAKQQSASAGKQTSTCAVTDQRYKEFIKTIESQGFGTTRLNLSKQLISGNCLTVQQVEGIATLLANETDKLEFVKYAYDYTSDKENVHRLMKLFKFDSSVRSYNDFISSKK